MYSLSDSVLYIPAKKMYTHYDYMMRCLDLARNGLGQVAPNPMVGCVVVHDHTLIGEGYHARFGGPHAEVMALASVTRPELLHQATLYVNLEPCSHHGKTPPCTELIISKKIPRVVVGCVDPFHRVAGKGIEQLRKNGCEVITGVAEKESRELNQRFLTFHEKKRPWIILKWAQTRDAFIDVARWKPNDPKPTWISSEHLRILVHKWRAEEAAIMAGTKTLLHDNPRLNVRQWYGKQPIRVILDKNCSLPDTLHVFDQIQNTWVFNALKDDVKGAIRWIKIPFDDHILAHITDYLYAHNIQSLFVEGGRMLLQSFIDAGLWDEARVFVGTQFFGQGVPAPLMPVGQTETIHFGEELLLVYRAHQQEADLK